jgi:hypothetical protein
LFIGASTQKKQPRLQAPAAPTAVDVEGVPIPRPVVRPVESRPEPALPALSGRQMFLDVPASPYGPAAQVEWVMTPEEQLQLAAGDEVLREVEVLDEASGSRRPVHVCLQNMLDPVGFVSTEGFKLVTIVQDVPFGEDRFAGLSPNSTSGTEITDISE